MLRKETPIPDQAEKWRRQRKTELKCRIRLSPRWTRGHIPPMVLSLLSATHVCIAKEPGQSAHITAITAHCLCPLLHIKRDNRHGATLHEATLQKAIFTICLRAGV